MLKLSKGGGFDPQHTRRERETYPVGTFVAAYLPPATAAVLFHSDRRSMAGLMVWTLIAIFAESHPIISKPVVIWWWRSATIRRNR